MSGWARPLSFIVLGAVVISIVGDLRRRHRLAVAVHLADHPRRLGAADPGGLQLRAQARDRGRRRLAGDGHLRLDHQHLPLAAEPDSVASPRRRRGARGEPVRLGPRVIVVASGAARDAVDGAGEVELALDRPDSSWRSGGRICAGSPTAIQPIGTIVPGSSTVLTCTTPWMRTSMPVPSRAPGKSAAPVAMKHPLSIRVPLTWACGPIRTSSPIVAGCCGAAADERVLHDHAARPDRDRAVLGGQHRAEQDPGVRADPDVAAQDRVRRHVGARIDLRRLSAML